MTLQPDIFTHVHKGLRRALFDACVALGRAGDDQVRASAARSLLAEVLHFVAHHGENEDTLLIPRLDATAPAIAERMRADHGRIDTALAALVRATADAPIDRLYVDLCGFTAVYLEHLQVEEQELEPGIRAALGPDQLALFGRESVALTAPADQRMMLGWMLRAMAQAEVDELLAKLPEPLAAELRTLLG